MTNRFVDAGKARPRPPARSHAESVGRTPLLLTDADGALERDAAAHEASGERPGAFVGERGVSGSLRVGGYMPEINKRNRLEWIESDADGNETIHKTEPGMSRTERSAVYMMSWLPVEWLM